MLQFIQSLHINGFDLLIAIGFIVYLVALGAEIRRRLSLDSSTPSTESLQALAGSWRQCADISTDFNEKAAWADCAESLEYELENSNENKEA